MIVDRYYYSQLNKREKIIYRAFYDGVKLHKDIIPLPVKGTVSEKTFHRVFMALTRDNPLIYYLNQSACNMATDALGHVAICPQYFFSKQKVKEYNRKIENAVNSLVVQLRLTEGSDYDKAVKVHDWLCLNVEYDMKGKDMNEVVRVIASHNIIGVFAHHRAQCEGIAKAAKVLLNSVDVRCIVATGMAKSTRENGPHAWNIVNLENSPYHMDVTWDLGMSDKSQNSISYDYFNVSDELIGADHRAEDELPACNSMELNYFAENNLVFDSWSNVNEYVIQELKKGKKELYFRFAGKRKEDMTSNIIQLMKNKIQERETKQIRLKHRENKVIGTYWIKMC